MLVYDMFAGDDLSLAALQHDVYDRALGVILAGCRAHYLDACQISGAEPDRWPEGRAVDGRAFQDAHDLAAAAWRWRVHPPQAWLPLDTLRMPPSDMGAWLDWLAGDVRGWREDAALIAGAVAMAWRPGTALAEAGRLAMGRALLARYGHVDWRPTVARAYGE